MKKTPENVAELIQKGINSDQITVCWGVAVNQFLIKPVWSVAPTEVLK
jgi:hypothetical protein